MKYLFLVALLCTAGVASAQWNPSDNYTGPIYYTGGNVGVGTTTPNSKFHIEGNTNAGSGAAIVNSDAGTSASASLTLQSSKGVLIMHANSTNFGGTILGTSAAGAGMLFTTSGSPLTKLAIGTRTNIPVHLSTNDAVRMTILGSGEIGIGTMSPESYLHVYNTNALGSAAGSFLPLTTHAGYSGANAFRQTEWLVRDAATSADWFTTRYHNAISVDNSFRTPGTDTKTWWERDPYNNIQSWGNANQTYLTLNGSSLGIGTTSPGHRLHVVGPSASGAAASTNAVILASAANSYDPVGAIQMTNDVSYGANYFGARARDNAGTLGAVLAGDVLTGLYGRGHTGTAWSNGMVAMRFVASQDFATGFGTQIEFATTSNGGTARSTRMVINHAGNVGLGTMTPSSLFHLRGGNPSLSFSDSDVAISSTNPNWVIRAHDGGNFRIQSTVDYATFSDRVTVLHNGYMGIGTKAA